jgi:hypothetical protein
LADAHFRGPGTPARTTEGITLAASARPIRLGAMAVLIVTLLGFGPVWEVV